jgi:hypothetical protein
MKTEFCSLNVRRVLTSPCREVDGLNLILIDHYAAALTPRLYCSEAALQLYGNIFLIAVCCLYICRPQRGLIGPLGFGGFTYI